MLTSAVIPLTSLQWYVRNKREKIHPTCMCKKETTLPHWKSPKTLRCFLRMRMGGWGWEDVCPSTSGCTSGGCFWYHTHLLWHHKTGYQTHRWARHHDASCSHPVDIAMFSLPPALLLSPPKCLFLFHFQRDFFLRCQTLGSDCSLRDPYLGLQ